MPESGPANLLKKRLWHRSFPVNVAKFLTTPFLQNTSVYKNALRSYADYFSKLPGKRRNIYNITSKLLTTVKNCRDFRELYLTSKYYEQSCVDVCTQMFNEKGTLDISQNSQGNVSTF